MLNFSYYNPVRVHFGKGSISRLEDLLEDFQRIMLVYGTGSIKRNGVYDQVMEVLEGKTVVEFGGISANPAYEDCMDAVALGKKENVDFILSVGGGSILDACKFISAALKHEGGDPWDILYKKTPVSEATPLGCVLTLPATGSEMNINSVISRRSTREKLHFGSPLVYPQFSILDPATTFSLPQRQTANGIVDTFAHVCEQYVTYDVDTPLQDMQAEAILKILVDFGPRALEEPENYDVRANLMWASTNALNGWIGLGTVQDWATHEIGHELTALYGLDHAVTLAILMPRVWREQKESKKEKLLQMGSRVFGLNSSSASEVIDKTESFFRSVGVKTRLQEHGIHPDEAATLIGKRFRDSGRSIGEKGEISPEDVEAIVRAC